MPDQPLVTSIDIINLSHSLKDICEVNCETPECLNQTLKMLLQFNLIKLNLLFSRQLDCIPIPDCPNPNCFNPLSCSQNRKVSPAPVHPVSQKTVDKGSPSDVCPLNYEVLSEPKLLGIDEISIYGDENTEITE